MFKEPSLAYYLPQAGGKIVVFLLILRALEPEF